VQERIEVDDDGLIQPVESMAFVLSEPRVGGDWVEQAGGQQRIHALGELQEDETNRMALGEQAIASSVRDAVDEALGPKLRQIVP
jgi:hypothetical protein